MKRVSAPLKLQAITTVLLVAAVSMVMFFTLQDAEGSAALSESVRSWLLRHGFEMQSHDLRSNVHVLEYFVFGLAVLCFWKSRGCRISVCVIVCCMFGLFDESVKVLLPTREFDLIDLLKDWVGVFLATLCVLAFGFVKRSVDKGAMGLDHNASKE